MPVRISRISRNLRGKLKKKKSFKKPRILQGGGGDNIFSGSDNSKFMFLN